MTKLEEKYIIKSNILANILYNIGYTFYKCINGIPYDFKVRKHKNCYRVNMYRPDNKHLTIFKINVNLQIIDIVDFITQRFELPKGEIDITDWELYLWGGKDIYDKTRRKVDSVGV